MHIGVAPGEPPAFAQAAGVFTVHFVPDGLARQHVARPTLPQLDLA